MANSSKKIVGVLITVLIFSALVGVIASQLTTAALNLSGAAATIVSTTIVLMFVVGVLLLVAREMDLI